MEDSILQLLKGDASTGEGRKANSLKVRHDVASNRKDYPLKGKKIDQQAKKKKSKQVSIEREFSKVLSQNASFDIAKLERLLIQASTRKSTISLKENSLVKVIKICTTQNTLIKAQEIDS